MHPLTLYSPCIILSANRISFVPMQLHARRTRVNHQISLPCFQSNLIVLILIVSRSRAVVAALRNIAASSLRLVQSSILQVSLVIILALLPLLLGLLAQLLRIHVRCHHVSCQRAHEFVSDAANLAGQHLLAFSLLKNKRNSHS